MTQIASPVRRRRKSTPWHVRLTDMLASKIITLGGIGTVAAVLLVVVVLIVNTLPLFLGATLQRGPRIPIDATNTMLLGSDEYGSIVWTLSQQGELAFREASTGQLISSNALTPPLADGDFITAARPDETATQSVLGLHSGGLQWIEITFESTFLNDRDLSDELRSHLDQGKSLFEGALYRRISDDLIRRVSPKPVLFGKREQVAQQPILHVELGPKLTSSKSQSFLASTERELIYGFEKTTTNLLTKKAKVDFQFKAYDPAELFDGKLVGCMLNDRGNRAFFATDDGFVHLFEFSLLQDPKRIDSIPLDLESPKQATVATRLLGRGTLLVGDTRGEVHGVFLAKSERAQQEANSERLVSVHRFPISTSPVRSLVASPTLRSVIATCEDARSKMIYVPTDETLLQLPSEEKASHLLGFSPRGDLLLSLNEQTLSQYPFDPGYPEASFRSLFGHLWYEGYDAPQYIWQSTTTSGATESKLSMIPLVFGTLKATFYTLLISIPLAIMAAVYSSEFMDRRWRANIKPAIEFMASIPSVVLGFTSAFVLAPWLRDSLDWAMMALLLIPVAYLFAAHLWCLLPVNAMIRLNALRLPLMFVVLPLAVFAAKPLVPFLQSWLFGTDLQTWLGGEVGNAYAGWFLILLPLVAMAILFVVLGILGPATRTLAIRMAPFPFALFNLVRLTLAIVAVLLVTYCAANLAEWIFGDIRGSIYGLYQERNAFLVGAVLGFAVIPIIYTISEDALQSVPAHLRSASLGCGATPWQTTIRVVVPTAMSGLFSAIMIGFGRAVGETMVVLMAAGNTPVMDINPFNGYRTLSATLATELPEAAAGSAHFRTLFLAALLLFGITLLANSAAELVRLRFRKRAYQL